MMIEELRRRRPIRKLSSVVVLVAISAVAGWWLGQTGFAEPRSAADQSHEGSLGGSPDHAEQPLDAPAVVRLSDSEFEEFGIEVASAGPGTLRFHFALPGEITVDPDRLAHIVPRAPGIVRQVEKGLGEDVSTGDVLARVESEKLGAAKGEYLAKRRDLELARADLEREQTIHDNTMKLLEILEGRPSLEDLRGMANLDAGQNRARLVSAYARWLLAEAVYNREKRLFERKISSEQDFLTAESEYKETDAAYLALRDTVEFSAWRGLLDARRRVDVSELQLKAAERHLHILGLTDEELMAYEGWSRNDEELSWYALRAPFDGTIIEKHVSTGELLSGDSDVFEVADLSSVWVNLSVYERDLARIECGQPVTIATNHDSPIAHGTIDWIAPFVDVKTRTATARVVLPNREGVWRPGLFVTGTVTAGEVKADVVVPRSVIQTLNGETVVFVLDAGALTPRHVRIGRTDAESAEILEGLVAGDQFVTRGAFTLKSELAKSGFEEGHAD